MGFVSIKESHVESDPLVLKSRFESEGIHCYLKNEFTTQLMSHMSTFVVEPQVSTSDLEKAYEILEELGNN